MTLTALERREAQTYIENELLAELGDLERRRVLRLVLEAMKPAPVPPEVAKAREAFDYLFSRAVYGTMDAAIGHYKGVLRAFIDRATPPLPAGFVAVPMPDAVDLSLIADMLDDYAVSLEPVFKPESIAEQSRLLRESVEADAHNVRTGTPSPPPPAEPARRLDGLENVRMLLRRLMDKLLPECECGLCPECGKSPVECSSTECSRTCQCCLCDHCMTRDAIADLSTIRVDAVAEGREARHWAFAAAEGLRGMILYAGDCAARVDQLGGDHLLSMLDRMKSEPMSATKACRWLGWIQAALVACGLTTLAAMKAHNKQHAAFHPAEASAQGEAVIAITDAMVEPACKAAAMYADGAVFPDAYSDEEVAGERASMRRALAALFRPDGPGAYCIGCQGAGMRNCANFTECSGATCISCHRPFNTAPPALADLVARLEGLAKEWREKANELETDAKDATRLEGAYALQSAAHTKRDCADELRAALAGVK